LYARLHLRCACRVRCGGSGSSPVRLELLRRRRLRLGSSGVSGLRIVAQCLKG